MRIKGGFGTHKALFFPPHSSASCVLIFKWQKPFSRMNLDEWKTLMGARIVCLILNDFLTALRYVSSFHPKHEESLTRNDLFLSHWEGLPVNHEFNRPHLSISFPQVFVSLWIIRSQGWSTLINQPLLSFVPQQTRQDKTALVRQILAKHYGAIGISFKHPNPHFFRQPNSHHVSDIDDALVMAQFEKKQQSPWPDRLIISSLTFPSISQRDFCNFIAENTISLSLTTLLRCFYFVSSSEVSQWVSKGSSFPDYISKKSRWTV